MIAASYQEGILLSTSSIEKHEANKLCYNV